MWVLLNAIQVFIMALWTIITILIALCFPLHIIYWIGHKIWCKSTIMMAGGRIKCSGKNNLVDGEHYIFLSNHTSWADILVILYATQRKGRFIAKKELAKVPFLGLIMKRMGMIFIDRDNPQKAATSLKNTLSQIEGGIDLVVFPEGTRSKTGRLNPFKKGVFFIAIKTGIPIIPIGIIGAQKVWHCNNFTLRPGIIQVNIGKPIATSNYDEKNITELIALVRTEILTLSNQKE